MKIKRIINIFLLLAAATGGLRAQDDGNQRKELILHFRFDRALVDSGYRANRNTLQTFKELFADSIQVARIDSIRICAYSSPDGNRLYNRKLAERRAKAVKGCLLWKYPHLDQYRIHTSARVENWEGLLAVVESTPDVPCKKQVMEILGSKATHRVKEARLKTLGGGAAYRYIQRYLLPGLRNASVCTVWMKQADEKLLITKKTMPIPARETTPPSPLTDGQKTKLMAGNGLSGRENKKYRKKVPFLALKTNMLFDLAMMPNIEAEVPIGKHFSVNGEIMFPWWLFKGDKYCMQILMGGAEGRYWLGNREKQKVLNGHFLGLYAGGGKYDLQWDRNGYQGEFFIAAGVSYGYAMNIAKNLNLEFSLGVGLLRTTYEHYHARDNYQTLLWQNNGRYTWLGPTKAKISLVWMLNRKAKGGER